MEYNVKYFKYPSGWQVRLYSEIVGVNTYELKRFNHYFTMDNDLVYELLWDDENEEYYHDYVHSNVEYWNNPFNGKIEKMPVEYDEKELERKKKRSIASSMGRTINSVYQKARANTWDWFVTFTFNPDKVDSMDYQSVVKKLSDWLSNSKKICPDMGYIIVPEKHKSGRYHFHGLFRQCDELGFVSSGKKTVTGETIYNVGKYKFGWTTATRIIDQSRVTKYIAKYISKDLVQVAFNKRRYWSSRNLAEPDVIEVFLDRQKLDMLADRLAEKATYIKCVENAEVKTIYFELPPGEMNDE